MEHMGSIPHSCAGVWGAFSTGREGFGFSEVPHRHSPSLPGEDVVGAARRRGCELARRRGTPLAVR